MGGTCASYPVVRHFSPFHIKLIYMVSVITLLKAWQLYHVESVHPPGHSVTAAVVRAMI